VIGLWWWAAGAVGAALALYIAGSVYLAAVLAWEDRRTVGLGYYGRPPEERERFKRRLRFHARLLGPILGFNSRLSRVDFRRVRVVHDGVSAPAGTCSRESLARAVAYGPRPEDVFVVTQMKCGTTWMQHVVYEVLNRGNGNLVESGKTLYSVSPWLEGRRSVPLDQAPLHGAERPSRIIKTHLPAELCPRSEAARYIYVARHPVSCFASCVDFIATNAGAMAPGLLACEEWFRSPDLMWWGTWPDHVRGWWERSRLSPNVRYAFFEDLKRDLPGEVRRVAEFLGLRPLDDGELARVVEKCGFDYMRRHQDAFEMHPPHVLQTSAALFVRGSADRHQDVPAEMRRRILAWCAERLRGSGFPPAGVYPELREPA
jgi:aryl sulfotransferase